MSVSVAFLIFTFFASSTEANERKPRWRPEYYPDPQLNPRGCMRDGAGWVCDPDGLLGVSESKALL